MSDKGDFFVVRKGATAVPNSLIHNKDLSYQALALALVSLSMPAGAKVGYRQLKGRGLGEAATRKALLELEEHHLRFRFRTRVEGKIRDLTVMSDTPLTVEEAYEEILARLERRALPGIDVVACVSHPDEAGVIRPRDLTTELSTGDDEPVKHRAAPSAARCDQHKRLPVDNCGGQSADLHECNVSAGRTVPRSTVARSAEAHITKVISKSSLRSDNSNQTSVGRVVGDGVVWAALPEVWWGWLGRSARERVVQVVQAGLSAGWTPEAIRARLQANPLPPNDQMRNPEGLIISRVRSVMEAGVPTATRHETRSERVARMAAALEEIAEGQSPLNSRAQLLRVLGIWNEFDIQSDGSLNALAERAYEVAKAANGSVEPRSSGHIPPYSASTDDGNSTGCDRFSPPSGEGAKHVCGTSVSPLKGKFHATKRN